MANNLDNVIESVTEAIELACNIGIQKSKQDIKKRIKAIQKKSIEDVVYKPYEPKFYQRRYYSNSDKSLGSTKNMVINSEKISLNGNQVKYSFDFYNIANFNSNYNSTYIYSYGFLSDLVEFGYGDKSEWYNKPRAFMELTGKKINKSMEDGKEIPYIIKSDIESVLKTKVK